MTMFESSVFAILLKRSCKDKNRVIVENAAAQQEGIVQWQDSHCVADELNNDEESRPLQATWSLKGELWNGTTFQS